ncbi:hypothetical protein VA613_07125 [Thiobacillus sedimenti]|uniref:Band 7 domain-containing protein n=1 Tax=Thiobacillus sedimenti TaxID=3110231 RepID=A0ABZ1CNR1_9PROT|nr:hypothetical protein [Thiobacillus sp. SCUT-2]WRS40643.1 hypothetical protein VA613_07125 [Thiobacillus sp. SCUT-2]
MFLFLARHRSQSKPVLGILAVRVDLEIHVTDVSPADQGDRVVRNEQLVVHAIVQAVGIEHELEAAEKPRGPSVAEGVVIANLDVRVRLERRDLFVSIQRFPIIDQETDADAAIRGMKDGVGKQLAGLIGMESEILEIQRALRRLDDLHANQEPVLACRENVKARLARMGMRCGCEMPAKAGCVRMAECGRGLARIIRTRRQAAACPQQGQERQHRQPPAGSLGRQAQCACPILRLDAGAQYGAPRGLHRCPGRASRKVPGASPGTAVAW